MKNLQPSGYEFSTVEEAGIIIDDLLNEKQVLLDKVRKLMLRIEYSERRVQHSSMELMYNGTTGLPNHKKMDKDIAPLLWDYFQLPEPPKINLILVKLDQNFLHCRQSFSEDVFNNILYTLAERLKDMIGQRGLLYQPRLDEFAVFLFDSLSREELKSFSFEVRAKIESVIGNQVYKVKIGCAIGIAVFPEDGLNKRILLANADMAMNTAVLQKLDIVFYDENMRNRVIGNLEMQNNLLSAMEIKSDLELADNFTLFFQPIITVSEICDEGIKADSIKAEVLIRWNDPNRGSMLPQNLIEVAEQTGLIMPIGRWLLKASMAKLAEWKKQYSELKLSINISPRQFFSYNFSEELKEIVDDSGIEPSDIFLEITETCLFNDQEHAVNEIETLNGMGFGIALDDFGTGYSSLGYLNKFKTDILKIDRVFTEGLMHEGKKRDVIKSIVNIGMKLGLDIVFEGIEDVHHLEQAHKLGCRTFQGFLFSKPLDASGFEAFLSKSSDKFIPYLLL